MKFQKLQEVFEKVKLQQEEFDSLFSIGEQRDAYMEYASLIKGRKAVFGIPTIDYALYGGVKPCYVCGIVGETDIGKTTLAQHLSYSNCEAMKNTITMLSSQETSAFDLYERMVQTFYNVSSIEVEQAFQEKKQLMKDTKSLNNKLSNLYTIARRCSVRDLFYYKLAIEHITTKKVGCLIVDWLGLVPHQDFKNEYDVTTNNMYDFEELALHSKLPVFIFLQINKSEGKSGQEIGLHSAKGPSVIEQVSKIFITINHFKREDANDFPADILKAWDSGLINVLKFTVKKKKYGRSKPTAVVLQNKKSLRLVEFNPHYKYHIDFMNEINGKPEKAIDIFNQNNTQTEEPF